MHCRSDWLMNSKSSRNKERREQLLSSSLQQRRSPSTSCWKLLGVRKLPWPSTFRNRKRKLLKVDLCFDNQRETIPKFIRICREAQTWNESQLQQWAKAAAQREADNLALLQYQRQDEELIKQLNASLERWYKHLTAAATSQIKELDLRSALHKIIKAAIFESGLMLKEGCICMLLGIDRQTIPRQTRRPS